MTSPRLATDQSSDLWPLEISPADPSGRWRAVFSLDIRSLALFRILLGINLLAVLLARLPFIADFYTDSGVLPRAAIIEGLALPDSWTPSIHLMSGEWSVQLALFLLALVAACALIVGYRTRLATAVSWFLFLSMHARNPLVDYYADSLLQALLFWAMFLPLNGRWSVDRWLHPEKPGLETSHSSWATQALIFQICLIYWFTGAMKWSPAWLTDASGVYYALSFDFAATRIGHVLLGFPALLRLITRGTIALELLGPFLLLSPIWTARLRILAVVLFVGFHAGLALSMRLAGFSVVCITAWLAFLPSIVWERLGARRGEPGSRPERSPRRLPDWVAALRQRSQGWGAVVTPPAPSDKVSALSNAIVFVALLIVFACNVLNYPYKEGLAPSVWKNVASIAGLDQQWAMFAAPPLVKDGWYVMEGVLLSGRHVDLWRGGGEPSYEKPFDVAATFGRSQWRPYLLRFSVNRYARYRMYFGRYLCRTWNAGHSGAGRLNVIYINFMRELTAPPGQVQGPATRELIWRGYCFAKPADW
jgi:hypothetical protein